MQRSIRFAVVLLVLALVAGACGGGKEIGKDVDVKGGGGNQGAIRGTTTVKRGGKSLPYSGAASRLSPRAAG